MGERNQNPSNTAKNILTISELPKSFQPNHNNIISIARCRDTIHRVIKYIRYIRQGGNCYKHRTAIGLLRTAHSCNEVIQRSIYLPNPCQANGGRQILYLHKEDGSDELIGKFNLQIKIFS